MSKNSTGRGTVYRARSAEAALTARRFVALGTAVFVAASVALIAVLLHPPILDVFR